MSAGGGDHRTGTGASRRRVLSVVSVAVFIGVGFLAPAQDARRCSDGDHQTVLPPASAPCEGDPVLMTPQP